LKDINKCCGVEQFNETLWESSTLKASMAYKNIGHYQAKKKVVMIHKE
jgi:hypothetical protein